MRNPHDPDDRSGMSPLETSEPAGHRPPAGERSVTPGELSARATPVEDGQRRGRPPEKPCVRCLVTNDDGIDSEGLRVLALAAAEPARRSPPSQRTGASWSSAAR